MAQRVPVCSLVAASVAAKTARAFPDSPGFVLAWRMRGVQDAFTRSQQRAAAAQAEAVVTLDADGGP